MATATKTKRTAKKPAGAEVGKKVLTAAFGALETAGRRITKFAHESKKKLSTNGHKTKAKAT
ncbi:MAG: hypothetical protein WEB06_10850 [Actinomycetota bacterium]